MWKRLAIISLAIVVASCTTVPPRDGQSERIPNATNFIRGYDPMTGAELWQLRGSSNITAPTPIFGDGLIANGTLYVRTEDQRIAIAATSAARD